MIIIRNLKNRNYVSGTQIKTLFCLWNEDGLFVLDFYLVFIQLLMIECGLGVLNSKIGMVASFWANIAHLYKTGISWFGNILANAYRNWKQYCALRWKNFRFWYVREDVLWYQKQKPHQPTLPIWDPKSTIGLYGLYEVDGGGRRLPQVEENGYKIKRRNCLMHS